MICTETILPCNDEAKSKLASVLRETLRDRVLLPQESKKQAEKRCLAVQVCMQVIYSKPMNIQPGSRQGSPPFNF